MDYKNHAFFATMAVVHIISTGPINFYWRVLYATTNFEIIFFTKITHWELFQVMFQLLAL